MSSSALHHLSWDAYCEHVHLSKVLTEGANACYAAKSSKPEAFLAQHYKSSVAADVIEAVEANEAADGHGGYTLALLLKLASGKAVERSMGTSPLLALHPGTSRKLTFGTLSRAATPLLTAPSPVNPKDPQANKPKPTIPAQRYEAAARVVNSGVAASLLGKSVVDQATCDEIIATADGTSTLSTMLAPTAAALSLSVAQAAAVILQTPLYRYIGSLSGVARPGVPGVPPHLAAAAIFLPRPIVTIFSTEPRHMGKVRVREVCLIPLHNGLTTSSAAATVQANLASEAGQPASPTTTTDPYTPLVSSPTCTQCGAFAAFSPRLVQQLHSIYEYLIQKLDDPPTNPDGGIKFNGYETLAQAVELIEEAVRESQCGAALGLDFQIGLVVDAALCYRTETAKYSFVEGTEYSGAQLAEALAQLCRDKKVAYVEDTHQENDHAEMRRLMHRVGATTVVASQHLFGGDLNVIATNAPQMLVNHMSMRLSDHGTLTHAVRCANTFRASYPGATIGIVGDSHESSATSSSATIDVAVALGARFVRIGGLLRSEHASLLNRLFEIQRGLERENLLIPPPLWESCHLELPPAPLEPVAEVNAKDAKKKK
jgi:enolase